MTRNHSLFTVTGGFLLALVVLGSSQLVASPRQAGHRTTTGLSLQSAEDAMARAVFQGWSQHTTADLIGPGVVDTTAPGATGVLWYSNAYQLQGTLQVQNLGDTTLQFRTTGGTLRLEVPPGESRTFGGYSSENIVPSGEGLEYAIVGPGTRTRFVWRVAD